MKKKIFIFLLSTMANVLLVCAINPTLDEKNQQIHKNSTSSNRGGRRGVLAMGEEGGSGEDDEREREHSEFVARLRERFDYLDLAVPFEENSDMTDSSSESSAQAPMDLSTSSSIGKHSPSSSDDSEKNSDSGLSAPSDAKASPFHFERKNSSTELDHYIQRFPEYLVDAVSRDIDALFLYPDRRTTSDGSKPHSEEDLVISVPNGETVKKAETDQGTCAGSSVTVPSAASTPSSQKEDSSLPASGAEDVKKVESDQGACASSSVTVPSAASTPPLPEDDLVLPVPSGGTVKRAETDQGACASSSATVPSAASTPPLPEDDLVLPVPSGGTVKRSETDQGTCASSSATVPSAANAPLSPSVSTVDLLRAYNYKREFDLAVAKANSILRKYEGIIEITGNTIVAGDVHGDLGTFKAIKKFISDEFNKKNADCAVFLGDIMDRGENSALTLLELIKFFNDNEGKVYILRGNHETRAMYMHDLTPGKSAKNDPLFQFVDREMLFNFFDNLPHAAIINKKVFAVHGGIPAKEHWEQFSKRKKYRECEVGFISSGIHECLWADYIPQLDYTFLGSYIGPSSLRGGGTLCYNEAAAVDFLKFLGCDSMVRGHQPEPDAFYRSTRDVIVTVFSAVENQRFSCAYLAFVDKSGYLDLSAYAKISDED